MSIINSVFTSSEEIVSAIERPLGVKRVTWAIESDIAFYAPILRKEAKLRIEFGTGTEATLIEFGFGEYVKNYDDNHGVYIWENHLSLQANLFPNKKNPIKTFEIEVYYSTDKAARPEEIVPKKIVEFSQSVTDIKPDFLLKSTNYSNNEKTPNAKEHLCSYGPEIFLLFIVSPVQCTTKQRDLPKH